MSKMAKFNDNAIMKYDKPIYDSAINKGWVVNPEYQNVPRTITFTYKSGRPSNISTYQITGTGYTTDFSQSNKIILKDVYYVQKVLYPNDDNIIGIDIQNAINLISIKMQETTDDPNRQHPSITSFNLSGENKLADATRMFFLCKTLTTISELNIPNVTNMRQMFSGCTSLSEIPPLNTSNVTNMEFAFSQCPITTIPQIDTSKVTSMGYMFSECKKLITIPQLDTSSLKDMHDMFNACSSLTTLPPLDTSNVDEVYEVFAGCTSLTEVPLLFNTNKTTSTLSVFKDCESLTSVPDLNTSNLTDTRRMFQGCKKLTTVPQLDTSKVTTMSLMFYNCASLTSMPQLDTSKVIQMNEMFYGCTNITGTWDILYDGNVDLVGIDGGIFRYTSKPITMRYKANNTDAAAYNAPSNVTKVVLP